MGPIGRVSYISHYLAGVKAAAKDERILKYVRGDELFIRRANVFFYLVRANIFFFFLCRIVRMTNCI